MLLLESNNNPVHKDDLTQATWGESDPPFVGRKQPEQSQINPKKRKRVMVNLDNINRRFETQKEERELQLLSPLERIAKAIQDDVATSNLCLVHKDWTAWNQKQRDSASRAAWSATDAANNSRSDNAAMMKLHSQAQQAHESAAQGYAKESNQYKEHMNEAATHARRSNEFRDKAANDKGFSTGASMAVHRAGYSNSSF